MHNRIVAAGIGVVAMTGTAWAAEDPMTVFYANTMVSRHADGSVNHVYFDRDGAFRITHDGKVIISGTFTYKAQGDQLCLSISRDDTGAIPITPGAPAPLCKSAHTDAKIGDAWLDKDPGGLDEHQSLVAGRN